MSDATGTASDVLQKALTAAGIPSRLDGHASAGCFWAEILGADGSRIWVNGANRRENELGYRPCEHDGWQAYYYADDDEEGIAVYRSQLTDIDTDTAGFVAVLKAFTQTRPGFLPARAPEPTRKTTDTTDTTVRLTVTIGADSAPSRLHIVLAA